MRRKLRAAALAVVRDTSRRAGQMGIRPPPRLRREIEQHAAVDLLALDGAVPAPRGPESLLCPVSAAALSRCSYPHRGLCELAVACEELLGWDLQKTIGLLQGLSNTSTASTDELAALARRAGQRIATRELLEARTPDILKRLDDIDPPVAKELRQYLQFWGCVPLVRRRAVRPWRINRIWWRI